MRGLARHSSQYTYDMTPREKREMITNAIIDDILTNMEDNDLGLIRDALETHFAHYAYDEVLKEYKERATK